MRAITFGLYGFAILFATACGSTSKKKDSSAPAASVDNSALALDEFKTQLGKIDTSCVSCHSEEEVAVKAVKFEKGDTEGNRKHLLGYFLQRDCDVDAMFEAITNAETHGTDGDGAGATQVTKSKITKKKLNAWIETEELCVASEPAEEEEE